MNRRLGWLIAAVWVLCAAPVFAGEAQKQNAPLIIGTELDYPPYSFLDENGKPTGYNVELTKAIAQVMQLDIEVKIGPWGEIRQALESGKIDAISGMFYSAQRDKLVDFSSPYTIIHQAIFVRKDAPAIETEEDLRGKNIIVVRGDIMHDYVLENGLSDKPVLVDTPVDALRLLASGEHDYALTAKLPGLYWLKELGLSNIEIAGPLLRPSEYSYAVTEGNAALRHLFSEGLAVLGETGAHKSIYDKWLGVLEPKGISRGTVIMSIGLVAVPLLLFLAVSVIWLRTLKRQVLKRTEDLRENEHRLDHLNRVLAAIRNVNQIITHEKDPTRLLDEACRLLVETRGFHNAWVVLTENGKPVEPFFHAGFEGGFAPMAERLLAGDLPSCALAALETGELQTRESPAVLCADCPLAPEDGGRAGFSLRLEHAGRVFGWLSVSVAPAFARDKEELDLFAEVGGDIAFALWSIEIETQRQTLEQKYAAVLATTSDAVIDADQEGIITLFNPGAEQLLNCPAEEAMGEPVARFCPEDLLEEQAELRQRVRETGSVRGVETERLTAGGRRVPVEMTLNRRDDDQGNIVGITAVLRDVTERKRMEKEREQLLHDTGERIKELRCMYGTAESIRIRDTLEQVFGDVVTLIPPGWQYPEITRARLRFGGREYISEPFEETEWKQSADIVIDGERRGTVEVFYLEDRPELDEGPFLKEERNLLDNIAHLLGEAGEKERRSNEKARIEEQYHQARKLESIGRLAGGVSHDLNNLLSPIIGYGEMLLDDLDPGDARRESVDEILRAGFRARDLVRQLLAFSRKQTLEYKPVDMNKAVTGFEKLLRRTIREDIEIEIIPSPDIGAVMADISQIEQVILNLVVNASDAMPEGGCLTIETASANLDEDYAAIHQGVRPGAYVMLAVSDTGCGMDDETREHAFEPFFSTKGEQGTGLGLATVYGIVKQHGGNIWVYSEPDKGTTFKIYLPVSEEAHVEEKATDKNATDLNGSETILLVEDDEQVRVLARAILRRQGYTVLVAENGLKALTVLASHDDPVQLLLTDVVMPEMNGKELFAKAAEKYPGLKVLYMSGYTANVIAHRGALEEGIAFIQKPFTVQALTAKVREVLEQD